jgi:hypothetical protein
MFHLCMKFHMHFYNVLLATAIKLKSKYRFYAFALLFTSKKITVIEVAYFWALLCYRVLRLYTK